jgi:alkylhydroperoxidase/carboxymuconolactone decarboxylase family protein YurZ
LLLGLSGAAYAQAHSNDKQIVKQQKIITISAYTAKGDLENLKAELNAGLDSGLTINESKEILVHLYAYCGFPRSLRGIQTLMEVLDERKANGIKDEMGREATPITDTRSRFDRGEEIQMKVTRRTVEELRGGYAAFSPEIAAFLKEHLFADLFERDVLSFSEREVVTVSALISMGGVEPMVKSHFIGALNVGVTADQLKQLISVIETQVDKKDADTAKPILEEVLSGRGK